MTTESKIPRYPFLAIDVPLALAEVAAEQLFALGALGVEQRDGTTLTKGKNSKALAPALSDIVWPSAPEPLEDDEVTLVGAFETLPEAQAALAQFEEDLNPRLEIVEGDAWADAWKEHFAPFLLTESLGIEPPWAKAPEKLRAGAPHWLELEPGRAFGTGLHATTALCAWAIEELVARQPIESLLDVGTGSGILALVACKLGVQRAFGLDLDPSAVSVARENAARNDLSGRFTAEVVDIAEVDEPFDLVVANIQCEVLESLARHLEGAVGKDGHLVLSGLLSGQDLRIAAAFDKKIVKKYESNGWLALVLR